MKNIISLFSFLAFTLTGLSQNPGEVLSYYKISETNDTAIIDTNYSEIGNHIVNIGDMDGNGVDDLATGMNFYNINSTGEILLLYLNNDGSVKSKSVIALYKGGLSEGFSDSILKIKNDIANLGDVDGDDINDIAINVETDLGNEVAILFMNANGTVKSHRRIGENLGGFNVNLPNDNEWGTGLGGIDDLDGDGINELIVGDPYGTGNEKGTLYILYLRNTGIVREYKKINSVEGGFGGDLTDGCSFGSSIASLGNKRIVVGANFAVSPGKTIYGGGVWILDLDANGKVTHEVLIAEQLNGFNESAMNPGQLGCDVDNIGDVNGDGVNDIVVGSLFAMEEDFKIFGVTYIMLLNQDGTVKDYERLGNYTGNLPYTLEENDFFGSGVAGMGDIDGDGKNDIAVGANGADGANNQKGEIHILFLDGAKIGVNKVQKEPLTIYPNPAGNSISIANTPLMEGTHTITIYDVAGRVVYTQTYFNQQQAIDVSVLGNGVYHVMLTNAKASYQGRFVVQH